MRGWKFIHFIFTWNLLLYSNSNSSWMKLLTTSTCNLSFVLHKCTFNNNFRYNFILFWSIDFMFRYSLKDRQIFLSLSVITILYYNENSPSKIVFLFLLTINWLNLLVLLNLFIVFTLHIFRLKIKLKIFKQLENLF